MLQKRRAFLKTSGLMAAMGLAGCTDGLLDQGGDGSGSGGGGWKYDPATLATVGNKFFGDMAFGQIYDNREYLPESTRSSFESQEEDSPIDPSDIEKMSGVGGGDIAIEGETASGFGSVAITGSWDKATMVDNVESEGEATKIGEYEGFSLYEDADWTGDSMSPGGETQASAVGAVGDDAMLVGMSGAQGTSSEVTGEDAVKAMIDASNGSAPLLENNSQYVGQITSSVSANSMLAGGEVDPNIVEFATQDMGSTEQQYVEGLRASGFGASIEGETTTFSVAILYETAAVAEETGIKELAEGLAPTLESENPALDSLESRYEENAIIIEAAGPTQKIFEEGQTTAGTQLDVANPSGNVLPQ